MAAGVGQVSVGAVGHFVQGDLRARWPIAMTPEPGVRVEAVGGQQAVPVGRDQVYCGGDVDGGAGRDEVVEVDPGPARLDTVAAVPELLAERVGAGGADGQQPVPV